MSNSRQTSDFISVKRRIFAVLSTYCATIWQKLILLLAVALIVLEFVIPHSYRGWEMNYQSSQNVGMPAIGYKFYRAPASDFINQSDVDPSFYNDTNRLVIQQYDMTELEPLPEYKIRRFKTPHDEEIEDPPQPPDINDRNYRKVIVRRDLTADDLDKLSVAPGIETVEFVFFPALKQNLLRGLQRFPSLTTIVFRFTERGALTPEFFEEIAKIPNLKTLVIDVQGDYWQNGTYFTSEYNWGDAQFELLAKSHSLMTLYVGSHANDFYYELQQAKKALPNIRVLPAYSALHVDPSWLLMIPPLVLLSFLIGTVLNHQYRSHISRLMPRFQAYHATIALTLLISLVAYCAWRLNTRDFNGLLAFVYCATIVSVGVGSQAIDYTMQSKRWAAWVYGIILCTLLISSSFLTVVSVVQASYYWFLFFFLIALSVSTYTTIRSLRTLVYTSESGRSLLSERKSWVKNSPDLRIKNDREYNLQAREKEIEALEPVNIFLSTWTRVTRWQLGNRPNPIRWYMYFLLPIVLTAITNILMRFTGDEFAYSWNNAKGQLIAYGILMPLVAVVSAATNWRARRLILPSELLRPVVTENVTHEWLIGICRDVTPLSVLSALWPAFLTNISFDRDQVAIAWSSIPTYYVLFAFLQVAAAIAIVTISMLIQNIWAIFFLIIGSTIAVFIAAVNIVQPLLPQNVPTSNDLALKVILLILAVFFTAMAWISSHFWLRRRNFDFRT